MDGYLVDLLGGWLASWLICWLAGWLVGWLADYLLTDAITHLGGRFVNLSVFKEKRANIVNKILGVCVGDVGGGTQMNGKIHKRIKCERELGTPTASQHNVLDSEKATHFS